MKMMKWEVVLVAPEISKAVSDMGALALSSHKSLVVLSKFQEVYFSMVDNDNRSSAKDLLEWAATMYETKCSQSLIAMEVPFGVRRQMYEVGSTLLDLIKLATTDTVHVSNIAIEPSLPASSDSSVASVISTEEDGTRFSLLGQTPYVEWAKDRAKNGLQVHRLTDLAEVLYNWYFNDYSHVASRFKLLGYEHKVNFI